MLPTDVIPQGRHVGELRGWSLWTGVTCVECPSCGFTFDASHADTDGTGYSCPLCIDGTV